MHELVVEILQTEVDYISSAPVDLSDRQKKLQ
jgi:hypothetical protein